MMTMACQSYIYSSSRVQDGHPMVLAFQANQVCHNLPVPNPQDVDKKPNFEEKSKHYKKEPTWLIIHATSESVATTPLIVATRCCPLQCDHFLPTLGIMLLLILQPH